MPTPKEVRAKTNRRRVVKRRLKKLKDYKIRDDPLDNRI